MYCFGDGNLPPSTPNIDGPLKGLPFIPYTFKFTSIDPAIENVSYYIEWGDGETTDWTAYRPSGSPGYSESHTWYGIGKYTIKAKAKDSNGLESPWTEYSFSTPRSRIYDNPIIRFFENHPLLYKMLQLLFRQLQI